MMSSEKDVMVWFDDHAKPFLSVHAPEKLDALQSDYTRIVEMILDSRKAHVDPKV